MIICRYQRLGSKENQPFVMTGEQEFRTSSESEADKVIARWNILGKFASEVNVIWKYVVTLYRIPTMNDFNNTDIRYLRECDC